MNAGPQDACQYRCVGARTPSGCLRGSSERGELIKRGEMDPRLSPHLVEPRMTLAPSNFVIVYHSREGTDLFFRDDYSTYQLTNFANPPSSLISINGQISPLGLVFSADHWMGAATDAVMMTVSPGEPGGAPPIGALGSTGQSPGHYLALARASGHDGMAGGQMMDIVSEEQSYDLRQVTRLQQLKTGALLAASVEMGAVLGRVAPEGRTHLRAYARDIGLAFQIADDLLDVEGDETLAGKALRKDEEQGKQTFVTLMGVDQARAQATMLVEQAGDHLASYGDDARLLVELAHFIVKRDH